MNKPCFDETNRFVGCSLPPNPELSAAGWELRFIADARMARDAQETYGDLGFDVRLEPVTTENLKDECSECKIIFDHFKAIYTRKRKS